MPSMKLDTVGKSSRLRIPRSNSDGMPRASSRTVPASPWVALRADALRASPCSQSASCPTAKCQRTTQALVTARGGALRLFVKAEYGPPGTSSGGGLWRCALDHGGSSVFLEGLFHEAQPNEPSLRRCLQCLCRRLRLLLGLMPAGDPRTHDGPMHCTRHGLRRDLPSRRWLHGPQKRVHDAGLQAVRGHLQGVRRGVRQTPDGSLPGMCPRLPRLRARTGQDDRLRRSVLSVCALVKSCVRPCRRTCDSQNQMRIRCATRWLCTWRATDQRFNDRTGM